MSDSHRSYTDLVRDFYLVFQPIVLVDPSLKSQIEDYEVLLREKSTNAFPYKDFEYIIGNNEGNSVLLQWFSAELRHVCLCMPQVKIDINLNPQQLLFDSTLNFLNNLEDLADRINVEITETPSRVASMNNATMTEKLREIVGLGFSATLDDVDSGDNNLNVVTQSAPILIVSSSHCLHLMANRLHK
ncbi:MAG: EAL domain-containing protein [Oenococcus sp.]|uniref:EAL domain-containing protein n=1 Tax=Oenococcus sp. TaxID=1979414 RepID=UPI0039ECBB27